MCFVILCRSEIEGSIRYHGKLLIFISNYNKALGSNPSWIMMGRVLDHWLYIPQVFSSVVEVGRDSFYTAQDYVAIT